MQKNSVFAQLGVALVASSTPLLGQTPARWELVPEQQVGSYDDPNYTLTRVSDLLVGPDGEFYVGQPQEQLVRVYDADGQYLRTIGREGAGPGEFRNLRRIGWRGDTLWVTEGFSPRVTLFGRHRAVFGTSSIDPVVQDEAYRGVFSPAALLPDGSVLAIPGGENSALAAGDVIRAPVLRLSRSGEVIGNLGYLRRRGRLVVIPVAGRMTVRFGHPFGVSDHWAVSADGSTVVLVHLPDPAHDGVAYFEVEILEPPFEETSTRRRYGYKPTRLPEGVIDSVIDFQAGQVARFGLTRAWARAMIRERLRASPFNPPITGVMAARDGTVWLRREGWKNTIDWVVLDRSGAVIAHVQVPRSWHILEADGESAWGTIVDDLGVPYVVRFGIARPPRKSDAHG